jgi:hypothetical protein
MHMLLDCHGAVESTVNSWNLPTGSEMIDCNGMHLVPILAAILTYLHAIDTRICCVRIIGRRCPMYRYRDLRNTWNGFSRS